MHPKWPLTRTSDDWWVLDTETSGCQHSAGGHSDPIKQIEIFLFGFRDSGGVLFGCLGTLSSTNTVLEYR